MNLEYHPAAQGELFPAPSAMTQPSERAVCEGCGAAFKPNRPDQRCCSATCRVRAFRKQKTLHPVFGYENSAERSPDCRSGAVADKETASARPLPTSLKPCSRPGFPPGLFEGRADALPTFFDNQGDQLIRIWGPNRLSAIELRTLRLESADLTFPHGRFHRRTA